MDEASRKQLRQTFDEVAGLYKYVRPTYPSELFDDLLELACLRPGDRALEIGCGTGQASVPLAERGLHLVCLELGEELARTAAQRLSVFPNVEVVPKAFEAWKAPDGSFDCVTAFASFHWLPPQVRCKKAAMLLRREGVLAICDWWDVRAEGGDPFFDEVITDYEAVLPNATDWAARRPGEVRGFASEIRASGLFAGVQTRRYSWTHRYDAAGYLAFLETRSSFRVLPPATRKDLRARIATRIANRPGGEVEAVYLATLDVASLDY